jgi:ComF family protein
MVHARFVFQNFLHFLIPESCLGCRQILSPAEKFLCVGCMHELPRTRYQVQRVNPMFTRFSGVLPIEGAMAWLYYSRGTVVQTLIHELKYKGAKDLAFFLGAAFAEEARIPFSVDLKNSVLVPVPLHLNRLKSRGYNQAEWIARGFASVIGIPVCTDLLVRTMDTKTQTQQDRLSRLINMEKVFNVHADTGENRQVILVDDVCTTGSTLLACAEKLHDAGLEKIRILCLATA